MPVRCDALQMRAARCLLSSFGGALLYLLELREREDVSDGRRKIQLVANDQLLRLLPCREDLPSVNCPYSDRAEEEILSCE
jgi:hypothetical protein